METFDVFNGKILGLEEIINNLNVLINNNTIAINNVVAGVDDNGDSIIEINAELDQVNADIAGFNAELDLIKATCCTTSPNPCTVIFKTTSQPSCIKGGQIIVYVGETNGYNVVQDSRYPNGIVPGSILDRNRAKKLREESKPKPPVPRTLRCLGLNGCYSPKQKYADKAPQSSAGAIIPTNSISGGWGWV